MIWIDVTARAARQVRSLAADQADVRAGLRVAVDREHRGADGPRIHLSLCTDRAGDDVVLPRYGFDVVVPGSDAEDVDGLRIDFVSTDEGAGFVIDHVPRQRRPATGAPPAAAPEPEPEPPPTGPPDDPDLHARVRRALDDVRPALQADGGDVELVAVRGDVAYLRLEGACSGCSAALLTLTALIEKAVLTAVPEVRRTALVA